jgi:hypothetical protein
MKIVARKAATIKDDPVFLERTVWQRTSEAAAHEALHRDWGCKFYSLHRSGRINNDQREAGDRYIALILDFRKLWRDPIGFSIDTPNQVRDYDVRCAETRPVEHAMGLAMAESMREESEFEDKRAKRISKRYREARALVGRINSVLEDLLMEDIWPSGEKWEREISDALIRLAYFFNTGKNKKGTNRV